MNPRPIGRASQLASALGLFLAATACHAQLALVAHSTSAASALTSEQAAALYLGKTDKLPSGAAAVLIDQPESSPMREQFYSKVAGKTPAQVKAAWTRLVFSGKAQMPKEAASSDDVKKRLASNPAAIGYIEKGAVDSSVKVLLAIE